MNQTHQLTGVVQSKSCTAKDRLTGVLSGTLSRSNSACHQPAIVGRQGSGKLWMVRGLDKMGHLRAGDPHGT